MTADKPELAAARAQLARRTADVRELHAKTPVGAQSEYLHALGATAFTHGVQIQLIDCLRAFDPALAASAIAERAAADVRGASLSLIHI